MAAHLSWQTACELGFRGKLDEWERLYVHRIIEAFLHVQCPKTLTLIGQTLLGVVEETAGLPRAEQLLFMQDHEPIS